MEFNKVLDTFSNHSTTIINYFEERLTKMLQRSRSMLKSKLFEAS
ncbi:hypothetical protein L4X53_17080 [Phocaeicola vulgatus]|nr:hypothetical protein [Phocaeicola vulgatus]MCG0353509.1 hypothetical protein [Phocaeicola vulgatus]